jgi:hypothetical protein
MLAAGHTPNGDLDSEGSGDAVANLRSGSSLPPVNGHGYAGFILGAPPGHGTTEESKSMTCTLAALATSFFLPKCRCDGFNISGISAAADCCSTPFATPLHMQAMPQFADSIRCLRFTIFIPTLRPAIGEMEIHPASPQYRNHRGVEYGKSDTGGSCDQD